LDVRWIRLQENCGPAAARNEGAAHARGRYLAFLDDDCLADKLWLKKLDEALEGTPRSAAGGKLVNGRPRNVYAVVNHAILDEVYRYYNADPAKSQFFATMNFAVPAEGFRELGGFNPSFRVSEDRDFCARWVERGLQLVYAEEALVVHDAAPGWREFWNRHYRFGRGAYQFRKTHAISGSGRVELEPAGFYRHLLVSPLRATSGFRGVLAMGLCCLSQFSSALGFWAAQRRT
jgi:GT2 family glycosyltransferase